jgi:predicted Co/Zn/Cd cation transporter (cation efflux family)
VFQVSVLHNLVHVLFGLLGLGAALRPRLAPAYLVGSGIIYAALTIYGLVVDHGSDANVVPLDTADTWLHAVLAAALLLIGFAVGSALQRKGQYTR